MEPEIKQLLEKDLALSVDNNKLLKKLIFSQRLGFVVSSIKWVVIIASILGITYWLGPKLQAILDNPQIQTILSTYKGFFN